MKVKELFDKITDNWPVKGACFLMAVCLYVFYTLSIQDSKSFTVPLTIESENGIAVAGSYPNRVKITLRGKTEDIAAVRENEVSAYLDLNYLSKDGTYKLPVLVNLSKQALLLETLEVHVSPQEVSLKVEEEINGFVPITPLVSGTPAHGYELSEITIEPSEVEITGPRSAVQNCTRIQTQAVSVKGADSTVVRTVNPDNLGRSLKLAGKQTVTVTALVVPTVMIRKFENVNVNFINLPEGFEVFPSKVNASFTLKGRMTELEKYAPSENSVTADFSVVEESDSYEIPVEHNFPSGFELVEFPLKKINVEVRKIQIADEFEQKINDLIDTNDTENSPISEENGEKPAGAQ